MKWLFALVLALLPTASLAQTQGQIDADIDSLLASGQTPPILATAVRTILHEMNATAYGLGTVSSVAVGCAGFSSGGAITTTGEIDASQASIAHVTTDTVGNAECGRLGTFNSGSAVAITLPRANFGGLFLPGWYEDFTNYGAGLVTFTTTTSTFLNNGTSTITLSQGQSFRLISSSVTPGSYDVTGIGTGGGGGGVTTVSNSDGTLTISPTSGAAVASLALAHANTWTGTQTFGPVIGAVSTQSGTTYTFAATDCGTTVRFTSNSAVTATIPAALSVGCHIEVVQRGTAKVSVTGTAVTACALTSAHAYTGTTGTAGSTVLVLIDAANTCVLTGDGS